MGKFERSVGLCPTYGNSKIRERKAFPEGGSFFPSQSLARLGARLGEAGGALYYLCGFNCDTRLLVL